ncbi:MAG: NAD(P)/FAD-dependent oxidoreductase [Desulfoplanes sp.]|nr:NAD(P)/FAD-dependent oxidoreductase [Desulfoplanes sp.]
MPKNIIVIGGGPAGLMAAITAARAGADVLILEKKDRPGRKLAITGKGRCNVSNTAPMREAIAHFFPKGKFLYQAFAQFFTPDLIRFFEEQGVSLKTERGGRMFPESDQAADIIHALLAAAKKANVIIRTSTPVQGLMVEQGRCVGVVTEKGERLPAAKVILTTGGASYPATGSTGDGYRLAGQVGHTIVPIRPALIPLTTAGDTAERLQGLSLKNAQVSVWVDNKKVTSLFGEMLFTHFGVSGPLILTLSSLIVDALGAKKSVMISIDLKPALDPKQLDDRLLRDIDLFGKRQSKTLFKGLLPASLIPVCLDATGIDSSLPANQITALQRKKLRNWLKDFQLPITGHRPLREAIITAGGVSTKEIDPRTMESKMCPGLFFAGEIMDIQADTGGFNLQAAFSTGWMAGKE